MPTVCGSAKQSQAKPKLLYKWNECVITGEAGTSKRRSISTEKDNRKKSLKVEPMKAN
jgi:hypothetical protein